MPPPTRESTASSPPGPVLQAINAALHREPLSTIVYGCLWCVILTVGTALALVALQIRMLYQLLGWYHTTRQNHHHSDHGRWEWRKRLNHGRACDPALHPECAMAVVITGCDSGFGHEMALWAAAAGYTVFAGCLHVPSGWEGPIPDRIVPFAMDVTSDVQVQDAVAKVQAWLREGGDVKSDSPEGKKSTTRVLHALINNAGVGTGGLVDWAELSDFQFCMDVNYMGMVRCCKAFLPIFKDQAIHRTYTDMRILNLTSMAGLVTGSLGMSAYAASKHAANAFSTVLRLELKGFGIQVTTVNPSFHGTPLVNTMGDETTKLWETLDPVKKEEYGEAYHERYRSLSVDMPRMVTWKSDVVAQEILKCLKMKHCPCDLLIGTDARFVLPILRMIPGWCLDLLLLADRPPVIAAMNRDRAQ